MPDNEKLLQETYRLAKENNVLLHRMRRSAFWGRLLTFVFYAALLLAPLWFYWHYLNGAVQTILEVYDKTNDTGGAAENEYQQFQQTLQQIQAKLQSLTSTSSSSTSH